MPHKKGKDRDPYGELTGPSVVDEIPLPPKKPSKKKRIREIKIFHLLKHLKNHIKYPLQVVKLKRHEPLKDLLLKENVVVEW